MSKPLFSHVMVYSYIMKEYVVIELKYADKPVFTDIVCTVLMKALDNNKPIHWLTPEEVQYYV